MENENNSAPARAIPVPPGGGSWRFDEAQWKWISNDPTPSEAGAVVVGSESNITNIEQEQ